MLQFLPVIGNLIGKFLGNRGKRDEYKHNINAAVHAQYAAEFGRSRNIFDSVIDGLNRLPRPIFAFGAIYLFYLCWAEPLVFVEGAKNLVLMPEEGWIILGLIVTFFFGDRTLKGLGKSKSLNEMRKEYKKLSRPTVTEEDPQEGISWDDRRSKRYEADWSGLNN